MWVPVAMSVLVYAGSAQFSAVGVLLAGGGPFAAAATGLLLNTRTVAFGLAVADLLGPGRAARFLGAHLVTDETVAFALAQPDPARRRAAFWISGLGLFVVWNLGVRCWKQSGKAAAMCDGWKIFTRRKPSWRPSNAARTRWQRARTSGSRSQRSGCCGPGLRRRDSLPAEVRQSQLNFISPLPQPVS